MAEKDEDKKKKKQGYSVLPKHLGGGPHGLGKNL